MLDAFSKKSIFNTRTISLLEQKEFRSIIFSYNKRIFKLNFFKLPINILNCPPLAMINIIKKKICLKWLKFRCNYGVALIIQFSMF